MFCRICKANIFGKGVATFLKTIDATVQPLKFIPLSWSLAEEIEAIRKASGNVQYVYTFASLFVWKETEKYEICIGNGAFVVKNGAEGENAYLFPCGSAKGKKEIIDSLIEYETPVFYSISDEDKEFLEKEYPDRFSFAERREDFIYLYDKKAQIELKGKDYKRLRHKVNQGREAAQEWVYEPIDASNVERALAINKAWAESLEDKASADVCAVETALNNFTRLSMWGFILKADGEDTAFVTGTFITPEIFDLCFCKVLNKHCGFFAKWALYCELPEEVHTVDSEEDLGIEGIRSHKLQRMPKELRRMWKGSFIK